MRVIISKSYLESFKYNENNLQLNDPTCRPKVSNVVEFSIPLDGCGTVKKVQWNIFLNIIFILLYFFSLSEVLVAGLCQTPKVGLVVWTVECLLAA